MKTPEKTNTPRTEKLDSRAAYDKWAPHYDTHPNPTVALARSALAREIPAADGLRVFEFGCGTGENLVYLARKGATRLCGVDISEGMLARARSKLEGQGARLRQVADGDVGLGQDETFDLILAVLVLEHLKDPGPLLQAAADHLAKDGRIYISELHPDRSAKGLAAHFRDNEGVEVSTTSYHRNSGDFRKLAQEAGLEVQEMRSWSPDEGTIKREPSAEKYRNMPLVLTMSFVKKQ